MPLHDLSSTPEPIAAVLDALQPVGTRVEINPWQGDSANTNWSTLVGGLADSGAVHTSVAGTRESSGAQNAEVTFKVALATGTWKLDLLTLGGSNLGIITVSLDTVSQGTIDLFAATFAVNVKKTLTGIVAASSSLHDLNFKMATKNASSSNFFGELVHIVLERTA